MDILAVILAAVGGFGFGALWYNVNGPKWMAAVGKTEEDIKASKDPTPFVIGGVAALLTAVMMRHVFVSSGIDSIGLGLVGGLGIGVFIVAPWIVLNHAFAGRPRELWWIDGGYAALACGIIGTVLGHFL
ncbi:MAG: DUF1761 domain-containing protein [Pseudomonadota bacterium]